MWKILLHINMDLGGPLTWTDPFLFKEVLYPPPLSKVGYTYHVFHFALVCNVFVLIYHVARREPINGWVKYRDDHSTRKTFLLSKAIEIAVADLRKCSKKIGY